MSPFVTLIICATAGAPAAPQTVSDWRKRASITINLDEEIPKSIVVRSGTTIFFTKANWFWIRMTDHPVVTLVSASHPLPANSMAFLAFGAGETAVTVVYRKEDGSEPTTSINLIVTASAAPERRDGKGDFLDPGSLADGMVLAFLGALVALLCCYRSKEDKSAKHSLPQ